ncbi:Golgi apparatus membrane protein tvp23, partial [Pestalotiopsis sp. IQ-011]
NLTNSDTSGWYNVTADSTGGDEGDLNEPLFLQVGWETSDKASSGWSYSRYFAISDGDTDPDTASFLSTKVAVDAYTECFTGASCTTPATSAAPSATSTSSATSGASTSSSAGASGSSSGSSGLSTGAIIGIAVACGVVGLALIGAAVWFLCFRRRRRHGDHSALAQQQQLQNGSYNMSDGGLPKAGMMMTRSDKDLPHVATDSPQSAYAPSRVLRDSMGSGAVGAGLMSGNDHVHHHNQHASVDMDHGGESENDNNNAYAPYRDHTPPPAVYAHAHHHHDGAASAGSQTSLPASLPGPRSPTPPISSRYAHLVEEGMTDEEIRRLEEEERALDVAIEDAGRSSRAQSRTQSRVF